MRKAFTRCARGKGYKAFDKQNREIGSRLGKEEHTSARFRLLVSEFHEHTVLVPLPGKLCESLSGVFSQKLDSSL